MADIFISYKREDHILAEALADGLISQGWSVWWDTRLTAGNSYDDIIEVELAKASCVIVLWSAKSIKSRWVRAEAGEGLEREILVPVFVEPVKPPLAFRRIQTGNLVGWDKKHTDTKFTRLVEDVRKLIGSSPANLGANGYTEPGLDIRYSDKSNDLKKNLSWLIGTGLLALFVLFYWVWPPIPPPEPANKGYIVYMYYRDAVADSTANLRLELSKLLRNAGFVVRQEPSERHPPFEEKDIDGECRAIMTDANSKQVPIGYYFPDKKKYRNNMSVYLTDAKLSVDAEGRAVWMSNVLGDYCTEGSSVWKNSFFGNSCNIKTFPEIGLFDISDKRHITMYFDIEENSSDSLCLPK